MMYGLLAFLFFGLSAQAATVFLSPPESLPSALSPQKANLVLNAHLGLEQFDIVDQPARLNHLFKERQFVGQGDQSALLLLVDEAYARDLIPSALSPSFSFSESSSDSLLSFIKTCNQRAAHVYTSVAGEPIIPTEGIPRTLDIFSAPTPANEAFIAEIATLFNYLDASASDSVVDRFAALTLTGVSKLAVAYGVSSESYRMAVETVHAAVEMALQDPSMRLAVITYVPSKKRSALVAEAKEVPVRTLSSSCYSSWVDCVEETSDCSGHGQCTNVTRAGRLCFVCACTQTVSETGKVRSWAGEMCERKDVSGPFVLITGTVITLILLIAGSVSLLYAVSTHELPSILTGGVTGGLRKE